MRALLTTCTADKDPREGLLPARLRYRGERIAAAERAAAAAGVPLLFLSGVYGVIDAERGIPRYDHALRPEEVDGLLPVVIGQLTALGVTGLEALLASADTPGWAPYHRLLAAGCQGAGVALRITLTGLV
jgi:hypothetical protein